MKRTSYVYDGFLKCYFDKKNLNNATIYTFIVMHCMTTLSDFDRFMVGDKFVFAYISYFTFNSTRAKHLIFLIALINNGLC